MERGKAESPNMYDYKANDTYNHNHVLKQIAVVNGEINRMSIKELQVRLKSHDLDPRGKKEVLRSRLKMYYKRKKLSLANVQDPNGTNYHFHYLVIIDFEATCDIGQPNTYRQEIIEFPAVLVNIKKREIIDEFHSYVRPVVNPKLSTFCTSLTGITQQVVNTAPFFPEVFAHFERWLEKHNLSCAHNNFCVVSDGPWDMSRFLVMQCRISNIDLPDWGKEWINIRKTYSNFYDTKRICLKDMLMRLGMRFEGKPHSGIDDSRNIARVTLMLMQDGAILRVNERLIPDSDSNSFSVVTVSRREFEEREKEKTNALDGGTTWQVSRRSSLSPAPVVPPDVDSEFPSLGSITTRLSQLTTK